VSIAEGMTPDQEQQLQRSVVKLLVGGGWGTGFCVAPGLILTCAHVVKAAQDGLVRVDWQGQERFTEAHILQVFPDTTVDLALLQVNGGEAIPWLPLDGQVQSGDDLYTYGYPRHYPDGAPVTLTVEGITGQGFIKFKAGAVQKGLSGAPLLNPRTGKVCGLVKYKEDFNNPVGGGGGIATQVILAKFPALHKPLTATSKVAAGPNPGTPYALPELQPPSRREDRNERILVEAVWTEVADRLRQSLHNAILIRLDMAEQRHQVRRPWDSQLRTANNREQPLTPNTHIADVFDRRDVGGKLLILGAPGAGKTTTMLDLAAVLVQRANLDSTEPMPIMVNLSSWQNAKQSLEDWLLGELKLKYGVSPKLGQRWLTEQKLLPLLDGLDELPAERQGPVVGQINDWMQSGHGPTRLLLCCRIEEYELHGEKLTLHGAVRLEPLTNEQLQQYLNALGMGSLWGTLQQDQALLGLVRTPLLLSVSILANESLDAAQWQRLETTQARVGYLLDAYVERRLHEAVNSREYTPRKQPTAKQTRQWLVWLAQQLQAQSKDEFLIEEMQPCLLDKETQKKYLNTISLGAALIFCLPLINMFLASANLAIILLGLFVTSFFFGLPFYITYYALNSKEIKIILAETVRWYPGNAIRQISHPIKVFWDECTRFSMPRFQILKYVSSQLSALKKQVRQSIKDRDFSLLPFNFIVSFGIALGAFLNYFLYRLGVIIIPDLPSPKETLTLVSFLGICFIGGVILVFPYLGISKGDNPLLIYTHQ
jgi:hypothetical protein